MGGMVAFFFSARPGSVCPSPSASLLTTLVCAAYGWAQDRVLWQPLRRRGLGIIQMMIVTIACRWRCSTRFQYFVGAGQVRITTSSPETVDIGPVTLTQFSFVAMGISIVVVAGVGYMLLRTRIAGPPARLPTTRACRGLRHRRRQGDPPGVDARSGPGPVLSGVHYALVTNGVKWDTGLQFLLLLFAAVTLRGLGTAFGAVVGSMVIGLVVELTNIWLPGDFKYATALLILILILLVRRRVCSVAPSGSARKDRHGDILYTMLQDAISPLTAAYVIAAHRPQHPLRLHRAAQHGPGGLHAHGGLRFAISTVEGAPAVAGRPDRARG